MATVLLEKETVVKVDTTAPVIEFYKDVQTQFILQQFLTQVKTFLN